MKGVLYLRVSVEDRLTKGVSIPGQRDLLKDYAKRENIEIVREYVDKGVSGKDMNRLSLKNLLDDAKKGKFDVVLCYHNDRLSRNTRDSLYIVDTLNRHNVIVRFLNLDMDIYSPEGELMFSTMASFSTYFRKDLIRKTKMGMDKLKKDGFWIGRIPDLFDRVEEDGHTRIVPKLIVYEILKRRKEGESYRSIAKNLETTHVKIFRTVRLMESLKGWQIKQKSDL